MERIYKLPVIAAPLAAMLAAVSPLPARAQAVDLVTVDVKAVARGYRTTQLIGRDVVNDKNQRIGTIDDIIIGRDRVLYAVLQVGGFLGVGGRLVAVPFQNLVLDHPDGKVMLPGATREELVTLPEFKFAG
jgi:sporulation protein YlmC with PRC-barrel domain